MIQGKKVLVVGLGLQGGGVGIAKYFAEKGNKVTVTDKKTSDQLSISVEKLKHLPISFHLGGHVLQDFLDADIIFKGPSVLWSTPEIIAAEKKGIQIEMELSYFASNFPGKIIGITGTRGKSTTTQLVFNLLKESGFSVHLGGGLPGISTINYLNTLGKNDWVVMEISSWALSGFHRKKISPHISLFTNLYPDHLNYYKNMEEYVFDKKAIFMYQKKQDFFILNSETWQRFFSSALPDGSPKPMTQKKLPSFSSIKSSINLFSKKDFPYELKYLLGEHNKENAAGVLKLAEVLSIDKRRAVGIITNFRGLPYRQEVVGEKNNVLFVNDTTSTTPIATVRAIESFGNRRIVLLLGGNSKKLPFENLITVLEKVEKIVLLAGSFTDEILEDLKEVVPNKITSDIYDDLQNAITKAYELALEISPSVVLFSPGATSFAMFNNEFHRGEEFNKVVKKII